jgi:hypothetical protein
MSKLIYSEVPEKISTEQSFIDQPQWIDDHGFVIVAISLFIAFGFIYLGYSSGDYSTGYQLCKDSILADVRTGTYESVDGIMAALKTC